MTSKRYERATRETTLDHSTPPSGSLGSVVRVTGFTFLGLVAGTAAGGAVGMAGEAVLSPRVEENGSDGSAPPLLQTLPLGVLAGMLFGAGAGLVLGAWGGSTYNAWLRSLE